MLNPHISNSESKIDPYLPGTKCWRASSSSGTRIQNTRVGGILFILDFSLARITVNASAKYSEKWAAFLIKWWKLSKENLIGERFSKNKAICLDKLPEELPC